MVASMRNFMAAPLVVVKNTFLDVLAPPPPADLNRASTEPARNEQDVYETLDFDFSRFNAIRVPARDMIMAPQPLLPVCPEEAELGEADQVAPVPKAEPKVVPQATQWNAAPKAAVKPAPQCDAAPRTTAATQHGPRAAPGDRRTTLLLRNVPASYSRAMLLELLDSAGFCGKYDFVYLPINFSTKAGLGYAFVNLTDTAHVTAFWAAFDGFSHWKQPSEKVCQVVWSGQYQGLEANVEKYRNSAVVHASIPEEHRPCVLVDGVVAPFPRPSKALPVPPRNNKKN